jgi:hypothetical protein
LKTPVSAVNIAYAETGRRVGFKGDKVPKEKKCLELRRISGVKRKKNITQRNVKKGRARYTDLHVGRQDIDPVATSIKEGGKPAGFSRLNIVCAVNDHDVRLLHGLGGHVDQFRRVFRTPIKVFAHR